MKNVKIFHVAHIRIEKESERDKEKKRERERVVAVVLFSSHQLFNENVHDYDERI